MVFPFPEIKIFQVFRIYTVFQSIGAAAAREGGRRRIFAHFQVVVEESEMRRRDDLDHFMGRIERRKGRVLLGHSGRNQFPGADDRRGLYFIGFRRGVAGGAAGGEQENAEVESHVLV